MIIILKEESSPEERTELKDYLADSVALFREDTMNGISIIHIIENTHLLDVRIIEDFPAVQKAVRLSSSTPLASSYKKSEKRIITVNDVQFGGDGLAVIAGPCSVESYDQLKAAAERLKDVGVRILRAGAFKPRTSPYSFQGLGKEGIEALASVKKETGMAVATEVMDTRDVETVGTVADIFQVGMRNMRNYPLLKELGGAGKPVLLKRAMDSTVEEWLLAAEYILNGGNKDVILCERGVLNANSCNGRTIMDLNGVIDAMKHSILPVIVDPSHAAAERDKVAPLARAAVAAGADGVMIEVHPNPRHALSDGFQALYPEQFETLLHDLIKLKEFIIKQVSE